MQFVFASHLADLRLAQVHGSGPSMDTLQGDIAGTQIKHVAAAAVIEPIQHGGVKRQNQAELTIPRKIKTEAGRPGQLEISTQGPCTRGNECAVSIFPVMRRLALNPAVRAGGTLIEDAKAL